MHIITHNTPIHTLIQHTSITHTSSHSHAYTHTFITLINSHPYTTHTHIPQTKSSKLQYLAEQINLGQSFGVLIKFKWQKLKAKKVKVTPSEE